MRRRHVLDVARHDLLDLRRQRGVWSGLLLIPFVTVSFLLLLPGVLAQREQANEARATYRVAVQTAARGEAAQVIETLALPARFELTPSEDASADVTTAEADVGIRFDPGVLARLQREEPVAGTAVVLSSRSKSRVALGELASALDVLGLRLVERRLEQRDVPAAAARPFTVEDVDLSATARGRRLALATLLPLLVLLPLSGTVGVAAQRISGSKDQRVFEPLLVLPFTRAELLAGKALSAYTIGVISLAAMAAPLLLGRTIPLGAAGRSVHLPFADIGVLLGIGIVLLALLVALGVAVGAASRTSAELGSVLQMATLPLFLMGSVLQFRSSIPTTPLLLALPFFGSLLCIRDAGIGALAAGDLALAVAATVGWGVLALGVASRFLRSERSVMRSTS